ncbi:hypothetical protein [Tissierella praeacuta]|uniref:hypothetical protein n=1 Tax=Tissierella praeacuta TaxID=43131 RepID=UPI00333E7CDE
MTMPNGFARNKKYNYTTCTRYICSYDSKYKILTVKSNNNLTIYQLGISKRDYLKLEKEIFKDILADKIFDNAKEY